jgi:release factor glutamine methyltransferase
MKALELLRTAKESLERSSIEDASREAETIIAHCLKTVRATLYRDNPEIPEDLATKINSLVKRRATREPLQYILGYIDFLGLKIKVGQGVLIPRPETELLAEEAVKIISNFKFQILNFKILDLCTGSGCLALSLAKELPDIEVYGIDTSDSALKYANENAELNMIKNVTFLKGSLFEPVKGLTFDLIVSNPPYIRSNDIKDLQPEIKGWEPQDALDGGADGLDYYKLIIHAVKNHLNEGGYLMLELGINQADAVKRMAENAGLKDIIFIKDYAGIDRILVTKI